MKEIREDMRTIAHLSRDQRRWLHALMFERVDGLVTGNRWANWVGDDAPDRADFLHVDGRAVLLPIEARRHPDIRVVQSMTSANQDLLVLLVTDTMFAANAGLDPTDVWVAYLALCVQAPESDWYVAVAFHETLLHLDHLPV